MSTQGTVTSETSIVNGIKTTIQNTKIVTTFSNLSRFSKISLGLYAGCVAVTFASSLYRDGKRGLINHRSERREKHSRDDLLDTNHFKRKTPTPQEIYQAEADAIWQNMSPLGSFFESIIFPWTMASNIMPWVIIKLNPPPELKDEKKE